MLAKVAVADSAKVHKKKYSVFIYSEAEPHAMYAKYLQTRKLCVLQYQDMDVTFSYISVYICLPICCKGSHCS